MANLRSTLLLTLLWLLGPARAHAQLPPRNQPDLPIDASAGDRVLEGVAGRLADNYVFPDKATAIASALRAHVHTGEYTKLTTARPLVERINRQLLEASHDRHLHVLYSYERIPLPSERKDTPLESKARASELRGENFGFARAEVLSGGVGYLDLRFFANPAQAGETMRAALSFVANTPALIIDLRANYGGDPQMIAEVLSYFFPGERVHITDFYWRPTHTTTQVFTKSLSEGRHYTGDIFVLTSARTISGGEEFAYDLQALERATLVGETTAGAAHPVTYHRIDDHFLAVVPSGRALNPITKTNWEGTGVVPDVAVAPELALKTAHLAALKKLHADAKIIDALSKELLDSRPKGKLQAKAQAQGR